MLRFAFGLFGRSLVELEVGIDDADPGPRPSLASLLPPQMAMFGPECTDECCAPATAQEKPPLGFAAPKK